jgi:hypothetical protein
MDFWPKSFPFPFRYLSYQKPNDLKRNNYSIFAHSVLGTVNIERERESFLVKNPNL